MPALLPEWLCFREAAPKASAVPLTEAQKDKLRARIETWQKRPVHLVYTIDPGIVGGLALKRGHVVYDASVQGQLDKFRETLREA